MLLRNTLPSDESNMRMGSKLRNMNLNLFSNTSNLELLTFANFAQNDRC